MEACYSDERGIFRHLGNLHEVLKTCPCTRSKTEHIPVYPHPHHMSPSFVGKTVNQICWENCNSTWQMKALLTYLMLNLSVHY